MITYQRNQLHVEKVSVESLARRFGTPLFIYSKNTLLENYHAYEKAFGTTPHLICYAVKANSNYTLLKTLAHEGAGADVTSGGELYRALQAGFSPDRIVYAGIGKTAPEIEYGLRNSICMFNVESIEELELINRIALKLKKKAPLAFRINPHVDPHTHHYITTGKSGSKFGIPHYEAVDAYRHAARLKGIEISGIHTHIGSQITEVEPFKLTAVRIAKIVSQLKSIGIALRSIDIGGGLGITYADEKTPSPRELISAVVPAFKGFQGNFICEPGRSIVGNTCVLIAQVTYRKTVEGKKYLIVDAGMNDLIRPTLYDAYHDIVPVTKTGRQGVKLDVVGPICESGDFLGKDRLLPWLGQGEYLAVRCAGAYGFAMSSQYNSRARAAEVLVDGKKVTLIRSRETYQDLVKNEVRLAGK